MYCRDISFIRSFDLGLTSAEGQKLECFKWAANNIFISTMKIIIYTQTVSKV